jgi:hypothetical protein
MQKAQGRMTPIESPYTPNDIRVSPTENSDVYRAYFNGIALMMLKASTSTISEKDLTTLWTSGDLAERKSIALKQMANGKSLIDGFIALVAPADFAKPHLAIINALGETHEILSRVANQTVLNPVEDLILLQEFQTRGSVISNNLETLFTSPILTTISWNESDPAVQLSEHTTQ